MNFFATTVISCVARYPKSFHRSGYSYTSCAAGEVPMSVLATANPRFSPISRAQKFIYPAPPPVPVPKKRPFQFSMGIHTSIPMFDSDVGRDINEIRRNGGSPVIIF